MYKPIEYNADALIQSEDNGNVSGYAVVWDVIDRKGDVHKRGAYKKTIAENPTIPLLPNHNQNDPIGVVTDLEEDHYGLKFTAKFTSTDTAQKYRALIMDGTISKFSMGWSVMRQKRMPSGGREILEVKIFEISPVAIPVGENTMVLEVNNMELTEDPAVIDRFYGLAKNIGDKKYKLANQAEILKLAEEYRKATEPSVDTPPEVEEEKQTADELLLTELNKQLKNYLQDGK